MIEDVRRRRAEGTWATHILYSCSRRRHYSRVGQGSDLPDIMQQTIFDRNVTARAAGMAVLLAMATATPATAVESPRPLSTAAVDSVPLEPSLMKEAVRVYLDCQRGCDHSYLRNEIPFINHVRDPEAAQIHVLITLQFTAAGGRIYRMSFIGQDEFSGDDHELAYVSQQSETADERREGLTRILKMGLVPYIAETALASQIDISFTEEGYVPPQTLQRDPWDHWVFRIGANGSLDREANEGDTEFRAYFSADRVTEVWKIRSDFRLDYDQRTFIRQDEEISTTRHDLDAGLNVVRSIGARWAVGGFSNVYSRSYLNMAGAVRLTPAIEYNIFPWDVYDRKSLTIAYTTGIRSFRYIDTTIFDKDAETLPFQSLRGAMRLTQRWGSFRSVIEGSHYFEDLEKYRLELDTDLSFRLTKGLSLEFGVDAESIHDQLYLPKGDATLEEILLRQRRLATTYQFGTRVGLRYTFGSIFNNVVNPRL